MKIKSFFSNISKLISARNEQGRLAIFDSLVFYTVFAFVLEFSIEILSNHSLVKALQFLIFNPFAYLFNVAIIFFTLTVCLLIPKRVFVFSLISVLWLGLGVANFVLKFKRVTPLTFVDFSLIPSVLKIFTVYLDVFEIVLISVLITAVVALLVLGAVKLKSYRIRIKKGLVSFVCCALILTISFNLGIWTSALSTDFDNISDAHWTLSCHREILFCILNGEAHSAEQQCRSHIARQTRHLYQIVGQIGKPDLPISKLMNKTKNGKVTS